MLLAKHSTPIPASEGPFQNICPMPAATPMIPKILTMTLPPFEFILSTIDECKIIYYLLVFVKILENPAEQVRGALVYFWLKA